MILLEYKGWQVHKHLNERARIYHNCKPGMSWATYFRYERNFRQTNCGYCAKSIPDAVVFVLEMIK